MSNHGFECIDVGSENCPCYLALSGDCLVCSRLRGKDECDCNWKGVCVYNEFIQGNKRVNNPRKDFTADIVYKKKYLDDLFVFGLKVGKGFAIKAERPGAYVFLRESGSGPYFDTPLCVMNSDVEAGVIAIAVKVISAKTKTLALAEDNLIIRGIYRNGILGAGFITSKTIKGKKVLIITKGIGIAPAILTANYLCCGNTVDMIIDKEKISEDIIGDYLEEGDGTIRFMSLNEEACSLEMEDILIRQKYDMVFLFTSDFFIEQAGGMVKRLLPNAGLAVSNNFHVCCGEGICGSCTVNDGGGGTLRMCKCNRLPEIKNI
ncbi:sulfide/dihydroorotate dehydrogenase-like FAD/NAD-binding protein [Bacillota bacterium]